jgi:GNAT superfamily N-acetyltransferase
MIISAAHRRRGLAVLLMRALITYTESVCGLDAIELGTSEFQRGAQRLYEGLGWELKKTEEEPSSFGKVMIWRLRRKVETKK